MKIVPDYLRSEVVGTDKRFALARFDYLKTLGRKVIRKILPLQMISSMQGLPGDILIFIQEEWSSLGCIRI